MIKAKIGNTLLFGIDSENVKRLKEGKPIHIKGADVQLDCDIFIAYGDTLKDIAKEFDLPLPH